MRQRPMAQRKTVESDDASEAESVWRKRKKRQQLLQSLRVREQGRNWRLRRSTLPLPLALAAVSAAAFCVALLRCRLLIAFFESGTAHSGTHTAVSVFARSSLVPLRFAEHVIRSARL